jgi:hypothetical protein
MEKTNKCVICNWTGRTHIHHIIPRSKGGTERDENLVELCPNHHSDSEDNEEDFAIQYGFIGEKINEEERNLLKEYAFLIFGFKNESTNLERLEELEKKYKWDKFDAIAYLMGLTRNFVVNNYPSL